MKYIFKFMQFMQGRYGQFDEFSKLLTYIGLAFGVLSFFWGGWIFRFIGLAVIAYALFRPFSRQPNQRVRELRWYVAVKQNIGTSQWRMKKRMHKLKNRWHQRKTHKFLSCPNCKQKIRVPKKNKKIRITCPACSHQFVKKT